MEDSQNQSKIEHWLIDSLLPGEIVYFSCFVSHYNQFLSENISGFLFITNIQIIFIKLESPHEFFIVRLHTVRKIEILGTATEKDANKLRIHCKDVRVVTFCIDKEHIKTVSDILWKRCFPAQTELCTFFFKRLTLPTELEERGVSRLGQRKQGSTEGEKLIVGDRRGTFGELPKVRTKSKRSAAVSAVFGDSPIDLDPTVIPESYLRKSSNNHLKENSTPKTLEEEPSEERDLRAGEEDCENRKIVKTGNFCVVVEGESDRRILESEGPLGGTQDVKRHTAPESSSGDKEYYQLNEIKISKSRSRVKERGPPKEGEDVKRAENIFLKYQSQSDPASPVPLKRPIQPEPASPDTDSGDQRVKLIGLRTNRNFKPSNPVDLPLLASPPAKPVEEPLEVITPLPGPPEPTPQPSPAETTITAPPPAETTDTPPQPAETNKSSISQSRPTDTQSRPMEAKIGNMRRLHSQGSRMDQINSSKSKPLSTSSKKEERKKKNLLRMSKNPGTDSKRKSTPGLRDFRKEPLKDSETQQNEKYFNGWDLYSHEVEYTRLGLSKYPWNMCKNLNYTLCDTYPEVFVTPLSLNAPIEKYVTFRTRNRMPAVVWLDKYSGAVLVRSSQPKVGLLGKREALDEEYFNALFQLGNHDNAVHILDVRPKMNAQANAVMGGGTENLKNYQSATREFYAIENIHKVRESWRRLSKLCTSRKFAESEKAQLQKIISDSGWYYYLGTILSASGRSRDLIIQGSSVLVHCSDGWDRTAQVLSLAEMMLDPYYRTLNGFAVVIEKEWCGFGHQFSLRTGHSNNMSNYKDDQRAPIFFQFMECVYQIMVKVPEYFQFTEDLLIFILDYYLSCYSGTFLGNCELERYEELKCKERTKSLWDFVAFKEEKFINEQYDKTKQVINIPMENFEFKFWKRYFLRWQTFQDPEIDKCSLQDLTLGYYNMTSDTLSDIEIPYSTSPPDLLLPRKIRRENMIGNRILSAAPPRLRTRSASDTSISPPQKRILFAD